MDIFKRFNYPKQRCFVCPPYGGENEGLKPLKHKARRRARHMLKHMDKNNASEERFLEENNRGEHSYSYS